jgi:hypothetical protein
VVLLTVELMEKDGLCVLLGHLTVIGGRTFMGLNYALSLKELDEFLPALLAGAPSSRVAS